MKKTFLISFLLWGLGCSKETPIQPPPPPHPPAQQLQEKTIQINNRKIKVEVAISTEEKAKGLMFRDSMPEDHGMLFVYEEERKVGFYMRNCRFPLSIAFIGADGKILQIEMMRPREEMPTFSHNNIKYVLEMNKGWFKKNDFKVGNIVKVNL